MELTVKFRDVLDGAANFLKGAERRRFMATVVRDLGPGGQAQAERELGWDRGTIRKGERELQTGVDIPDGRAGCRRTRIDDKLPVIREDIRGVVECWCRTDPRFQSPPPRAEPNSDTTCTHIRVSGEAMDWNPMRGKQPRVCGQPNICRWHPTYPVPA